MLSKAHLVVESIACINGDAAAAVISLRTWIMSRVNCQRQKLRFFVHTQKLQPQRNFPGGSLDLNLDRYFCEPPTTCRSFDAVAVLARGWLIIQRHSSALVRFCVSWNGDGVMDWQRKVGSNILLISCDALKVLSLNNWNFKRVLID